MGVVSCCRRLVLPAPSFASVLGYCLLWGEGAVVGKGGVIIVRERKTAGRGARDMWSSSSLLLLTVVYIFWQGRLDELQICNAEYTGQARVRPVISDDHTFLFPCRVQRK